MNNGNPFGSGLISQELLQLEETPSVEVPTLLLSLLAVVTNASQIFKHNGRTFGERCHDLFTEAMISVFLKTVRLASYFSKVSFDASLAFVSNRSQITAKSVIPTVNLLNMPRSKELIVRSDGEFLHATVDANVVPGINRIGNVILKDNVKKNTITMNKQVCGTSTPTEVLLEVFRNGNLELPATSCGQQRHFVPVKPDVVGAQTSLPNGTLLALGTTDWFWCFIAAVGMLLTKCLKPFQFLLSVLDSCCGTFEGFCCLHPSGTSQLRGEILSDSGVGFVMERHTVTVFVCSTRLADKVERLV